jgi:hypothetical protein
MTRVREFYSNEIKSKRSDFALGYLIYLLTD